ncbi:MAG: glycosyltransferase family 4 protein [Nanoarchaeota archaeon]|nr:glycosyltransferase family 4 protein [Nanoarchaeota archaeon]
MKVLYIHELYPPELVGGGEIYAENLVGELHKRGINVMVLTGTKGPNMVEKKNGIIVQRLHFKTRREFMFKIKEIRKVIRRFGPDIIHTNAFTACVPAYFAARKFKIPVVVNLHFLFLEEYFRYHPKYRAYAFKIMERNILKLPYNKIIALSYEIFCNLKRLGLKNKSVLIEHPIDTKLFKPKAKPNKFTIGSQITLEPSKRLDLFIDLAKRMKNVRFVAIGYCTKQMKAEFDKYGIKYMKRVPHNKMPKFYNNINVYFGHGMAAKEAMSSGCVSILNEATPRLLRYHYKELRAHTMLSGDPELIINKLMKNKKFYKSVSKKSINFIRKNYDTKIIIPKIINVYKELIK